MTRFWSNRPVTCACCGTFTRCAHTGSRWLCDACFTALHGTEEKRR